MKYIYFLILLLPFSVFADSNIIIKSDSKIDMVRVTGCVVNLQTRVTTCVKSSVDNVDTGKLDALGNSIITTFSAGNFSLRVPPGRYVPFLRTDYVLNGVIKSSYTYMNQQPFYSSSILLADNQVSTIYIKSNDVIKINSVCDNFNGTYTVKGSGFGVVKGNVVMSGSSNYSSIAVWKQREIVVVQQLGFPILPLTVISKDNGSSLVFDLDTDIPFCSN